METFFAFLQQAERELMIFIVKTWNISIIKLSVGFLILLAYF